MIGIGVIGCGYWGPNIVRNFRDLDSAEVRALCDRDPERLALARQVPGVRTFVDHRALLDDPEIDAVAICTPVRSHHAIAKAALLAGKHVMVEKPLTDSVETAEELVKLAAERRLALHVDHTFVYSGAVRKIRSIVNSGDLGELLYVDSVRVNLGLFQSDVNVIWDLAPHDVSILAHLIEADPVWVSANGAAHFGQFEAQAYVTIQYPGSLIAHLHVNWLAPVKIRSTLIGGSKSMIVYDDLAPSEKVRVYDKGISLSNASDARAQALVDYRVGDMRAPYIDKTEPLQRACEAFLESIESGQPSPTDGRAGLAVVRILAAAQRSIDRAGERVMLGAPV